MWDRGAPRPHSYGLSVVAVLFLNSKQILGTLLGTSAPGLSQSSLFPWMLRFWCSPTRTRLGRSSSHTWLRAAPPSRSSSVSVARRGGNRLARQKSASSIGGRNCLECIRNLHHHTIPEPLSVERRTCGHPPADCFFNCLDCFDSRAGAWRYVLHVALVVWVLRRDPVLASQLVAQFEKKQANATRSAQSIEAQGEALDTAPPLLAVAWLFLQNFLQSPSPGRALKGAFLENCPGLRLVSAHRNSSRAPRLEAP